MKSAYDRLMEKLRDAAREGRLSEDELIERFHYLKQGGDFQKVDEMEAPSEYARGFLDAMKTIGVKP